MDAVFVETGADSGANSIILDARGRLGVDHVVAGADSFGRGNPARGANVKLVGGIIQELGNDPDADVRGASLDFQAGEVRQRGRQRDKNSACKQQPVLER